MYIGEIGGLTCCSSKTISNESVLITGCSGTGKSAKMQQMEIDRSREGATVLVVDVAQSHDREHIFYQIRDEYTNCENRIAPIEDGLGFPFLQDLDVEVLVSILGNCFQLGIRQKIALREAAQLSDKYVDEQGDRLMALGISLSEMKSLDAVKALDKMRTVLFSGVMRRSRKQIERGRINIIDLSGLDDETRTCMTELLLACFWDYIRKTVGGSDRYVFALDEFQNLSLGKNSVICKMLREGRKFGVSFLLVTQTLSLFPTDMMSVINQAGTRLYFRPARNEITKQAREIAPDQPLRWKRVLSNLRVGECIAVGDLSVNGKLIERPLVIR